MSSPSFAHYVSQTTRRACSLCTFKLIVLGKHKHLPNTNNRRADYRSQAHSQQASVFQLFLRKPREKLFLPGGRLFPTLLRHGEQCRKSTRAKIGYGKKCGRWDSNPHEASASNHFKWSTVYHSSTPAYNHFSHRTPHRRFFNSRVTVPHPPTTEERVQKENPLWYPR